MPGNSFGQLFRITTFGESHGPAVGVVIDGCPAGMELSEEDIQKELDKRRPGQSEVTTPRKESDLVKIYSGVFEGKTTGMPIMLMAENQNVRSEDYEHLRNVFRPSHADYVYQQKYGIRDWRGGGRSSARETWARVAAGAVAKKFLREEVGLNVLAYVSQVGEVKAEVDYQKVSKKDVEKNIVRCPDQGAAEKMIDLIKKLKKEGDSVGGVVQVVMSNMPVGLGEPVFDKLEADLAKGMLSIGASKGFEIGSGFAAAGMKGSEHNDEFEIVDEKVRMKTNNAGGVLGGISAGEDVHFKVAFKPTSTIGKKQQTVDVEGQEVELEAKGRHDPCILPRAVPVVEAMTWLILMDHHMRNS
ncbi:chorismate synthase [Patescibacteria group bacterium]